jgi:hypothetical protein
MSAYSGSNYTSFESIKVQWETHDFLLLQNTFEFTYLSQISYLQYSSLHPITDPFQYTKSKKKILFFCLWQSTVNQIVDF